MADLLEGKRLLQTRGSRLMHNPPTIPAKNLSTIISVRLWMIKSMEIAILKNSIANTRRIIPTYFVKTPRQREPNRLPKENRNPDKLLFDL